MSLKTTTGTPDPLSKEEAVAVLKFSIAEVYCEPKPGHLRPLYDSAMAKTNSQLRTVDWVETYVPPLLGRPIRADDTARDLVIALGGVPDA